VDEYLLEINDLRRRIAKLKVEHASAVIIEELEVQLRILKAIYDATAQLYAEGESDRRLRLSFQQQELGDWTFENVYFYVYDQAASLEPNGHDLASLIWHQDYAAFLRSTIPAK
jgi:hypothetical protein